MLPLEYDTLTEVTKEDDGFVEEMATYKSLCYYVTHDGLVKKDKAIFERSYMSVQ